jgi:hypothetical protein
MMADRMEVMNAPTDPRDGFVIEGGSGFGMPAGAGFETVEDGLTGATVTPGKVMAGSSAIIARSKPAHPSWLSTTLGS